MTDAPASNIIGWPHTARFYTREEREIINFCETGGQRMTQARIELGLAQARAISEIGERPQATRQQS
jgi:hypothetical protein